jgi:hypothetical protein
VGTLSTADPDAGNTFTYTLVAGDTAAFNINGSDLRTSAVFNYEAQSSYTVTVRSTDQGGLYYEKVFIITVTDVNEAPVITEGPSISVTMSENNTPILFSLTLNATDEDTADTLTWSISSPASNGIASASGTGSSKTIGYMPNTNYTGSDSFVVQVSDGNGGIDTITVDVTIEVVMYTISGNAGVGSAILSYTDGTPKTVTAGNDGEYTFTVSSNWTGIVTPSLAGYTFDPVSRSYTNVLSDRINENYTATQIEYTLTITSAHGTVGRDPDQTTYHYGDVVLLTATPDIGWSFAGWTGDVSGTANPFLVTIDSNISITANYIQYHYYLPIVMINQNR